MQLERANAIYSGTYRAAGLLGPPVAGILIALLGASNALWIDAATFAVSAGIIAAFVPSVAVQHTKEAPDLEVRALGRPAKDPLPRTCREMFVASR